MAAEEALSFTMHSLKTTLLTWGLQIQVGVEERAAQGHHRLRTSSGCVEKYRCDDVLPALRCQRAVIRAVRSGWVSCTALARGAVAVAERDPGHLLLPPGQEQSLLESETEAEDDAADNSSVSSEGELVDFDDDGVQSDWSLTLRMGLYLGPRILNVMSGWYHRVVQSDPSAGTSADSAFGKACRPSGTLGDHYEVRTLDPGLEGCCACRHSAALVCQMAHSWHSCSDDSQSAWYLLTVLQHFGCFAWTPEWVMTGG